MVSFLSWTKKTWILPTSVDFSQLTDPSFLQKRMMSLPSVLLWLNTPVKRVTIKVVPWIHFPHEIHKLLQPRLHKYKKEKKIKLFRQGQCNIHLPEWPESTHSASRRERNTELHHNLLPHAERKLITIRFDAFNVNKARRATGEMQVRCKWGLTFMRLGKRKYWVCCGLRWGVCHIVYIGFLFVMATETQLICSGCFISSIKHCCWCFSYINVEKCPKLLCFSTRNNGCSHVTHRKLGHDLTLSVNSFLHAEVKLGWLDHLSTSSWILYRSLLPSYLYPRIGL